MSEKSEAEKWAHFDFPGLSKEENGVRAFARLQGIDATIAQAQGVFVEAKCGDCPAKPDELIGMGMMLQKLLWWRGI